MKEPFLINPVRRRRTTTRRSTGRKGLPGPLLRRMIKTHGRKRGMKEAWKAYRSGVTRNPWPDDAAGHKTASRKGWRRRFAGVKGHDAPYGAHYPPARGPSRRKRKNPFGEEVIIVGANPRRRRRRKRSMFMLNANPRRRRRSPRRRRNAVSAANPRRRRRSYYRLNANPRRRRRRISSVRRRRRMRRNPAGATVGALSFKRPMTLLMPVLTGIVSKVATDKIPVMLNITQPLPKAGIQLAVAFGGGMLLRRVIGAANANVWTLLGIITVATNLLNTYILKTTLSGLGAFPQLNYPAYGGYSGYQIPEAYPEYGMGGLGAYPYEMVEY